MWIDGMGPPTHPINPHQGGFCVEFYMFSLCMFEFSPGSPNNRQQNFKILPIKDGIIGRFCGSVPYKEPFSFQRLVMCYNDMLQSISLCMAVHSDVRLVMWPTMMACTTWLICSKELFIRFKSFVNVTNLLRTFSGDPVWMLTYPVPAPSSADAGLVRVFPVSRWPARHHSPLWQQLPERSTDE